MKNDNIYNMNMEGVLTPDSSMFENETSKTLRKVGLWLIDHVPTALIVLGIAAYYVSLSHLG